MSDLKPTYEELISLCDACSDLILGGESGWQNMEFDEFKKLVIKSVSSKRANPWIEFDVDDKSTWPGGEDSWCLVNADGAVNCMMFDGEGVFYDATHSPCHNIVVKEITHYMLIPGDNNANR